MSTGAEACRGSWDADSWDADSPPAQRLLPAWRTLDGGRRTRSLREREDSAVTATGGSWVGRRSGGIQPCALGTALRIA